MSKKKTMEVKVPSKLEYRQADIVQLRGLKSRTQWNGKRAEIIGLFDESTQRWPIRLLTQRKKGKSASLSADESSPASVSDASAESSAAPATKSDDSPRALLKASNIRLIQRGPHWTLDPVNNDGQLLYMIMHSYTKDFNAFAQLTRRKKSIFHEDFSYRLHSGTVVNGLAEFDASLNRLKMQVSEMSGSTGSSRTTSMSSSVSRRIDPYFSDKTHVEVVDSDSMSKFKVVVVIDLRETETTRLMCIDSSDGSMKEVITTGKKPSTADSSVAAPFESREWVRTTLVELKEGLVWKCTFLGYEIRYPPSTEDSLTKPKSRSGSEDSCDPTADETAVMTGSEAELAGIVSAIKQAKIAGEESRSDSKE